jgi:hypothetical protein
MRSFFLLAVFTAAVPLLVYGQTDPGAQTKPTPAAASQQSGAVEQTLIQLDRELMDAAVRKDKTFFQQTALDRYVFVNPGGGVQERSAPADGPNMESIQTETVVVRVHGDTAVLTGKAMVKGKLANGTDISGPYTYMRVFVKQKGQWRLAAMSAVPIQQPKPTPTAMPSPTP